MMTRRNKLWLLMMIAVLSVAGIYRLKFDSDVLDLLPQDIHSVQGLKLFQKHFTNSRQLLITLTGKGKDQVEDYAARISAALIARTNLVRDVTWRPPWLEHPELASELIAYLWINQPPEVFASFVERLTPDKLPGILAETQSRLATTMSPADIAQLSYDPLGFTQFPEDIRRSAGGFGDGSGIFSSPDGLFRVIFVDSSENLDDYKQCIKWMGEIESTVNQAVGKSKAQDDDLKVGYTGRPAFVAEISTSMKKDMIQSIFGTSLIIAILFWIAHRRILPMLWLLVLLGVILGATMLLGGLIFGTINLISLGFAGILLGLAVDYAVVHYQEALSHGDLSIPEVRRAIAPSIFWAAITTVSAFLTLNLGGLPGLGQLGSLVALGVLLSAMVMIYAYLPPLFRARMKQVELKPVTAPLEETRSTALSFKNLRWSITAFIVIGSIVSFLIMGFPKVDATAAALQPRNSQAYATLDLVKHNLGQKVEPQWLLISGRSEQEVADKMSQVKITLNLAVSNHFISSFTLPSYLWPNPENQLKNIQLAGGLIQRRNELKDSVLTSGFTKDAASLMDSVVNEWENSAKKPSPWWPTNQLAEWVLGKLAIHDGDALIGAAYIYPNDASAGANAKSLAQLESILPGEGVLLSGWELLGSTLLKRVQENLWRMAVPMAALILVSLWLAFRGIKEMALSLAALFLSGIILLAVMNFMGWAWNLLNLMSIPLILGTGVDYGIFMQLALRRHRENNERVFHSVGKALLLCGGTAVCGFASLAISSNLGMSSLGKICSVGIAANVLSSVFILPAWRGSFITATTDTISSQPARPSSLYSGSMWKLAGTIVNILPPLVSRQIGSALGSLYGMLSARRRSIVRDNLAPVCQDDLSKVDALTNKLFRNFGIKIVDLLKFESSAKPPDLLADWSGLAIFEAAEARKKGVLLVTIHLGNWEFGGAYLSMRGRNLIVLTQPEPDQNLTEIRKASRKTRGIETMVVGEDPFAFVELIKRLQDGATVALLMDRPQPSKAALVELYGKPFAASIAVAELARATGSAIVPGFIVHGKAGYEAHFLPEVAYERAGLGNRESRLKLTQEILRAFEPVIQQHLSQWYHFVPVWPQPNTK